MKQKLPEILEQPTKPEKLSEKVSWLSGEGAGSWFEIVKENNSFLVARYSPAGNLECKGIFNCDNVLNLDEDFIVSYPSFCSLVTVLQNDFIYTLKLVQKL